MFAKNAMVLRSFSDIFTMLAMITRKAKSSFNYLKLACSVLALNVPIKSIFLSIPSLLSLFDTVFRSNAVWEGIRRSVKLSLSPNGAKVIGSVI